MCLPSRELKRHFDGRYSLVGNVTPHTLSLFAISIVSKTNLLAEQSFITIFGYQANLIRMSGFLLRWQFPMNLSCHASIYA